jgi:hypothetical protein
LASYQGQHVHQFLDVDAERRCRQDQDTTRELLLPLERFTEPRVLALCTMGLVDN